MSDRIPIAITDEGRLIVSAMLVNPISRKNVPVNFILDTGAQVTTLSQQDVQKLDIDYNALPHNPHGIGGLGGTAECRLVSDILLVVPCGQSGQALQVVLKDVHVIRTLDPTVKVNRKSFKTTTNMVVVPSLLGVDFMTMNHLMLHCDFKNRTGYMQLP